MAYCNVGVFTWDLMLFLLGTKKWGSSFHPKSELCFSNCFCNSAFHLKVLLACTCPLCYVYAGHCCNSFLARPCNVHVNVCPGHPRTCIHQCYIVIKTQFCAECIYKCDCDTICLPQMDRRTNGQADSRS